MMTPEELIPWGFFAVLFALALRLLAGDDNDHDKNNDKK